MNVVCAGCNEHPECCRCGSAQVRDEYTRVTNRLLERIAVALERIADGAPKPEKKEKVALVASRQMGKATKNEVQLLIKAYIDAYRGRYGEKSRPDIGGRVQGLMKTMLKDHPLERLVALVQAFLQMDDDWFKKRCHDFPTLYENVGKVQTALLNGTARAADRSYWSKVWGSDGTKELRDADRAADSKLRGARLQGRADQALLEGPRKDG
jgi:hypothetical protein